MAGSLTAPVPVFSGLSRINFSWLFPAVTWLLFTDIFDRGNNTGAVIIYYPSLSERFPLECEQYKSDFRIEEKTDE